MIKIAGFMGEERVNTKSITNVGQTGQMRVCYHFCLLKVFGTGRQVQQIVHHTMDKFFFTETGFQQLRNALCFFCNYFQVLLQFNLLDMYSEPLTTF